MKYAFVLPFVLLNSAAHAQDISQMSQAAIEQSVGSLYINNISKSVQISAMKLQNDSLTKENADLKSELVKLRGDAPKIDTPKPE